MLVANEDMDPALVAGKAWVDNVAKDLPPYNTDLSPQQLAARGLRVYQELFQQPKLSRAEALHFLTALFPDKPVRHALHPVADQIDLQSTGMLDVTQCLLLADGVYRWMQAEEQDVKDSRSTASLPGPPGALDSSALASGLGTLRSIMLRPQEPPGLQR